MRSTVGRLVATLVVAAVTVVAATVAAASTHKQLTMGVVLIAANDPANQIMLSGAKAEAAAKGWKVTVIDANGSADAANSALQNLAQRKVDGILAAVFPGTSLRAGLAATRAAHIPVVSWGGGLAPGIYAANASTGSLAVPIARKIAADMHGKGSVLALTYHTGRICRVREAAFDAVMKKFPAIKVQKEEVPIPGFVEGGAKYAIAWLAGHPQGKAGYAIWGCWDGPAVGAVSALRQSGRTDVKAYGQNGQADALNLIQRGSYTATMWQNSTAEGKQLVDVLAQVKANGSFKPRTFDIPGTLVTQQNIAAFLKSHPDALK